MGKKFRKDASCLLCGSIDIRLISSEVSGAPEAAIYQCVDCRIIFQSPIMSEGEENQFYEKDFPGYMEGRAGTPSWKSSDSHFASFIRNEGLRRLNKLKGTLQTDWDILEIGSSTGYFLELIRPYVRSVIGVEPGPEHADFAVNRGIRTVPSIEALDKDIRYDAILIYYVLEHMRDPVDFLATFESFLKPTGQLFIEVPNVQDILLSRYNVPNFGSFYWQKMHYFYFCPQTLENVLEHAGFTCRLIPEQRYDLSNHMVWLRDGRPGGMSRFKDIFSVELEDAYSEALKRKWLCDTIFAIADSSDRSAPNKAMLESS